MDNFKGVHNKRHNGSVFWGMREKNPFLQKGVIKMAEQIKILIKRSPFLMGFIRIIDMTCLSRRTAYRTTLRFSEWTMVYKDWEKVSNDLSIAVEKYRTLQIAHHGTTSTKAIPTKSTAAIAG